MFGWGFVREGGEGAYPDPVVISCHVSVAIGLATADWGLEWCEARCTWCVCATLGNKLVRMRAASSSANVRLCGAYIGACASKICTFVYGVAIPAPPPPKKRKSNKHV